MPCFLTPTKRHEAAVQHGQFDGIGDRHEGCAATNEDFLLLRLLHIGVALSGPRPVLAVVMVVMAGATTACTTHCATRGPHRGASTRRQLVACFGSPKKNRETYVVCVCRYTTFTPRPFTSSTPVHW